MLRSTHHSLLARLRVLALTAAVAIAASQRAEAAPQCSLPGDQLEPNSDCASATTATLPYAVLGLNVGFGDPDFFRCTVPAGVVLEATVSVAPNSPDFVVVSITDGVTCGALPGGGFANGFPGADGTARWANRSGVPAVVVVACRNDLFSCGVYDLTLSTVPDPCAVPVVDVFEPNDDCTSATSILPGVYPGLQGAIASLDEDVFRVVIPPGHRLEVAAESVVPDLVMSVEPWSLECGLPDLVAQVNPGYAAVLNGGPNPVDFAFRVTVPERTPFTPVACGAYQLTVSSAPSPCPGIPPDAFEPNDACSEARPVMPGFYPGLTLENDQDPDWFSADLLRGEQLIMEVNFDRQFATLRPLFLQGCVWGLVPDLTETPTGFRAIWTNNTSVDYDARFGVTIGGPEPFACSRYDMSVAIGPIVDPCPTDMFEDNDDCATAVPLGDGLYAGLHMSSVDYDHYEFEVAPGSLLTIEVIADMPGGEGPRFEVYNVGSPCLGNGDIARGRALFRGRTAQWINDTGLIQRVRAAITLAGLYGTCAEYDLMVLGTTTPGLLGDQFCPSRLNSLLTRVLALAEGTTSIGGQDLSLIAQPLPTNSNGFFLYARSQAAPTPVSGGLLCLGSPIVRLNQFVFNSGNTGLATLELPYGSLPVPVAAGETWSFQYWYRNGGGSNFSTGLTLQFTP